MPDPHQLTFDEFFWVASLVILIAHEALKARTAADPIAIFKPTVILAVVLAYYALIGPLIALSSGEWFDRGVDRRPDMIFGWAGAAVFYASTLIGFYWLPARQGRRRLLVGSAAQPALLYRYGTRLCQLGLALFSVVAGVSVVVALLNPFAAARLLGGGGANLFGAGGISSYFLLALNFLIPGIALLFASWVTSRRHLPQLLLWSGAATGLFLSLGFRFRLVLMLVPLLLIWYLVQQRRPRLVIAAALGAGLIFMAGYVELTRSYGRGLDTTAVAELSNEEIFAKGFGEAHVFLTTGAMIAATPAVNPHVGLQPLISVLQFPIPRAFFPEKDTFGYLNRSIQNLFRSPTLGTGAAILCYGEWFLMAGWPSLIGMSLAFGWLLRSLWNWLLFRRHEALAVTCYSVAASFLYLVVSRGYLAQVVAAAAFILLPLFWIYRRSSRPIQLRAAPAPAPANLPTAPPLPRR